MFTRSLNRLVLFFWVLSLAACDPRPPSAATIAVAKPSATQAPAAAELTTTSPVTSRASGVDGGGTAARLSRVAGTYQFTEGPAADKAGNVYFSDVNAGKIYRWSPDGQVTVFLEGLKGPNGLAFDGNGMLIACEGGKGRLIALDPQGALTVLADQYNGVRFNEPNDLWIDAQGGIYFTDPAYQSPVVQDGQHVYYLAPDRSRLARVIADLVRPNGIAGTADGKTLYVADHGAGRTFAYDIGPGGALSNKHLFAATGSDGMTLDVTGHLYLTTPNQVQVFDAAGNHLQDIQTPENPTNVTFIGADSRTLFITARSAVYTLPMAAGGASATSGALAVSDAKGLTLSSPEVPDGGALPAEYTCDGASASLPLAWTGAPAGTKSWAVIMHHVAGPGDTHWYWVLYNIPADVTGLAKNNAGIGTLGTNSVNGKNAYAPPCSKGPGEKAYTYTVYALSAQPQPGAPAAQVNREALLAAMQNITLASAELHVTYTRK